MFDPELLLSGKLLKSEDEVKAAGQITARAYSDEMKMLCDEYSIPEAAVKVASEETEPDADGGLGADDIGEDGLTDNGRLLLEALGSEE